MTWLARGAALGLGLGAAWGVLARVWMRLISTEPEFSWTGTLLIIGFSALLGLGVGVVDAARRTGRSGLWTLAVVPGLVLFLSPGMVLAPCFVLGGLAWGARGRALRAVGLLVIVGTFGAAAFAAVGLPDGSGGADLRGTAVFATGFAAMALTLAWASSLVWQRSARDEREREEVPAGHPADRVSRHL